MTIERVLNDEMYAWKDDARRYLEGESMVTGDWSLTFASRVSWLIDEMARQVTEVERLRDWNNALIQNEARLREENERLRGELKDYTQNGLWREWRQRALDSEATLDICAEEKAVLRADRDRLHRIEEALVEMVRCFGGLDKSKMYAAALKQASAALAGQPTEEKT